MYYHSTTVGFTEIPRALACLNIFTVGCPFKCPGCQNPDLQDFNNPQRKIFDITEIQKEIDNSKGYITGICWLGGEPLYQFKDCMINNRKLKALYPNFIFTLFTGHVLADIKKDNPDEYIELLNGGFDYIIDGTWNGHPLGTEGCNQKVYKLTPINEHEFDFIEMSYEEYQAKK